MTHSRFGAFAYYVLPLLIWMGFIFYLSTDAASSGATRPVVDGLLLRLFPGLRDLLGQSGVDAVNAVLRKLAHGSEYTILGILAYRAVVFGRTRFRASHVIMPYVLGCLYAASDEFHQTFSPTRGPSFEDVMIDSGGVALGVLICCTLRMLQYEKQRVASASTTRPPSG